MEFADFQDMPRGVKLAIKRDLAQRAIDIVTMYHPQPVLGAEIEAQITETTPTVDTAGGEPIGNHVEIASAVSYGIGLAVTRKAIHPSMRGNQLEYRLPANPIEAGHVTT